MKVEIKLPRETGGVMVAEEVKKQKVGVNRRGGGGMYLTYYIHQKKIKISI